MCTRPSINPARLWERLQSMAKIGATAAGGCNRQALTDEDARGRQLFARWCREAGCEIRLDAIGNMFARRRGSDPSAPPVMTGSHLDTQPTGGKHDGVYGVLAGLEVLETLNDHGVSAHRPVDVVVWTNEEGSPNTVPGEVVFTADLRHPDTDCYQAMLASCEQSVSRACHDLGLTGNADRIWEAPGVGFDGGCIAAVRNAVQGRGYPAMEMISGAGHDACNIAAVAPVSMIFIPSEDGLSHNEAEAILPEHAEAGANILLDAILERSCA